MANELHYINQLSKHSHIPLQKMALNYCLQNQNVDNVLIGVDNLNQLNQNLDFAGGILSEDIIDKINEIHITDTDLLNPSLWNQ